jgi:cell division cycle 20-like protein 1, cofactor of APC complex
MDRFIPSRKMLRPDYLSVKEVPNREPTRMAGSDDLLPDLYRHYVMEDSSSPTRRTSIESFENCNLFRYGEQSSGVENEERGREKALTADMGQKLSSFKNSGRKISKLPVKVLDAPALQDDFYLNLIDWSPQNYLAVGLATSVYLWNATNSKVTKLCDLGIQNIATSVSCSGKSPLVALGTNSGEVQIWDVEKVKVTSRLTGHSLRVGAMSWSSSLLSTGSRDKTILQRDLRCSAPFVAKLAGHKQEICGLKWSFDEQQLCSGGNDNRLLVWNSHFTEPVVKFTDHLAAVKAMAWSPHQHGLLVSGGGTADRTIKVRNTLTGTTQNSYDVGSQVCNLMFSKSVN